MNPPTNDPKEAKILDVIDEEIKSFIKTTSDIARERRNPNKRRGKVKKLEKKDLKRLGFIKK